MSNIKILFRNILDYATTTLVEETYTTNMGQSNLTHAGRYYRFRSSEGELAPSIKFNLGGEVENITDVFVFNTNLENDATIRTYLYDADLQAGSTLYDSTAVSVLTAGTTSLMGSNKTIHKSFTQVGGVMSGKIVLSDSGNVDNYVEASRAFVGTCWAPSIGVSYSSTDWGWGDTTTQYRTAGGSLRSDGGRRYREMTLNFDMLTEQEMLDLQEHCWYVGLEKDFAVACFSDFTGQMERDFIIQAKLTAKPVIKPIGFDYYSAKLDIAEV